MSAARDILRQGRRDLHRERAVPAFYIAVPSAIPHSCTVRVFDKGIVTGRVAGATAAGYAQMHEDSVRLVFLIDDAPSPIRTGAIVSIEIGEAYRIANVAPPHDITINADVTRLSVSEAVGLPVP